MTERIKSTRNANNSERQRESAPVSRANVAADAPRTIGFTGVQQAAGNLAVLRLFGDCVIQTKLEVGQPGDIYECEADRVANEVVRQMNAPKPQDLEARQLRQESQNRLVLKPLLHQIDGGAAGGGGGMTVPRSLEATIQRMRGGGQRMPNRLLKPLEQAFGGDVHSIKIHANSESDTLNQSLNAHAFASGTDIFFRQNSYHPESRQGQILIAHELAHSVQQKNASSAPRIQCREFGDIIRFDSLPGRPIRARVLGCFPDDEIARELYGCELPIMHFGELTGDVIRIDYDRLLPRWRQYFERESSGETISTIRREESGIPSSSGIRGVESTPGEHAAITRTVDDIAGRLVNYTSAADSRHIITLFRSMSPREMNLTVQELSGRSAEMHESSSGPLYRLFEDMEEEDRVSLALLLMANGVLPQGTVAHLLAGRTWAGRWMPVTTEAGTEAAQYYANLWVRGSERGGITGFLQQVGAGLGGFFSSLWTPETASDTVLALSIARYAQVFPRAVGLPAAVLGSAQTGLSIGQVMTGVNLWGEPLTEEDRVRHWILAVTGIAVIAGGVICQYGTSSRGGGRVLTDEEVAEFYRTHQIVHRYTMSDGTRAEVWAPTGTNTNSLTIPETLPRPLPPPPRPVRLLLPSVRSAGSQAEGQPPSRTIPPEALEPHPFSPETSSVEAPLELATGPPVPSELLEPHPVALPEQIPSLPRDLNVGTYGRAGTQYHLYTTAEVAFGMRIDFDPMTRLPRSVEYIQVDPGTETLPPRPSRFRTTEMISREYQLRHEAYTGTEFERGHLMPREAAASYPEALSDIDVMSNIAPMFGRGASGINQSIWRSFELLASEQAHQYGWIRVVIEVTTRPFSSSSGGLPEVSGYTRTHYAPNGDFLFGVSVLNQ